MHFSYEGGIDKNTKIFSVSFVEQLNEIHDKDIQSKLISLLAETISELFISLSGEERSRKEMNILMRKKAEEAFPDLNLFEINDKDSEEKIEEKHKIINILSEFSSSYSNNC